MTTEEKLNQAAGTIKEGGTPLLHKKIMILIHITIVAEEKETSV
jgi:hypothetical protein